MYLQNIINWHSLFFGWCKRKIIICRKNVLRCCRYPNSTAFAMLKEKFDKASGVKLHKQKFTKRIKERYLIMIVYKNILIRISLAITQ